MIATDIALLEKHGWTVERDHPLEIRHNESGSFLSGNLAWNIIHDIIDSERENREEMVAYRVSSQLLEHGTQNETAVDDILILTEGCDIGEHLQMLYGGNHEIVNFYSIRLDNVHVSTQYLKAEARKLVKF